MDCVCMSYSARHDERIFRLCTLAELLVVGRRRGRNTLEGSVDGEEHEGSVHVLTPVSCSTVGSKFTFVRDGQPVTDRFRL